MIIKLRDLVLVLGLAAALALVAASCASTSDVVEVAEAAPVNDEADHSDDDDHGDEDHGDDDHGDDDHGDEDHDDHDDHDDHEDHDDHGEEDHEDHGDKDQAAGGLDAHVHGSAELLVAWSGGDVVVDLVSPAINIFGFEREPATDEEEAIVAEGLNFLGTPGAVVFNAEADCAQAGGVESDFVVEDSHAEVSTSWQFVCDNPDEINQLDASALFEAFPGIEDIDAQWASDAGQSASELDPSSTTLLFE